MTRIAEDAFGVRDSRFSPPGITDSGSVLSAGQLVDAKCPFKRMLNSGLQ
jgi:hypothetical protein